jgi:peptidoglycan/xylan/chitin deacetylase (PgdA/CDA1 family)
MEEILKGCARLPAAATAETCDDIDALVTEIASELAMCFNSQEPNDALAEAYRDEMNRLIERAHRDGVRFSQHSWEHDALPKVAPPGYRQHTWERDERVPKAPETRSDVRARLCVEPRPKVPETRASGQRQGFVTVDAIPNRRVDPKPRDIPMPDGVKLSWEPLTADQMDPTIMQHLRVQFGGHFQ